jgi:hypothetical protein
MDNHSNIKYIMNEVRDVIKEFTVYGEKCLTIPVKESMVFLNMKMGDHYIFLYIREGDEWVPMKRNEIGIIDPPVIEEKVRINIDGRKQGTEKNHKLSIGVYYNLFISDQEYGVLADGALLIVGNGRSYKLDVLEEHRACFKRVWYYR